MESIEYKYVVQYFVYEPSYYENSEKIYSTFKFSSQLDALVKIEELKEAKQKNLDINGITLIETKTTYF